MNVTSLCHRLCEMCSAALHCTAEPDSLRTPRAEILKRRRLHGGRGRTTPSRHHRHRAGSARDSAGPEPGLVPARAHAHPNTPRPPSEPGRGPSRAPPPDSDPDGAEATGWALPDQTPPRLPRARSTCPAPFSLGEAAGTRPHPTACL
jgi:hypothetical protein